MDKNIVIYAIVSLAILLLAFFSFGDFSFIKSSNIVSSTNSQKSITVSNGDIPKECQIPAGQDLIGWKEHLGHHSETKYCLGYFD